MPIEPLRFLHAADFHLEQPPFGLERVPEPFERLFLDAAYEAATRVFDTALSQRAAFVVLAGDLVDCQRSGPRGPAFLVEQFGRLAEANIHVYWATGRADRQSMWPAWCQLPSNVRLFAAGQPQQHLYGEQGQPRASLIGASRVEGKGLRLADFQPNADGLFTIGVAHGMFNPEALAQCNLGYWALGGRHARQTVGPAPRAAHYCGSPQGRHPGETGTHGCTLVEVDGQGRVKTVPVATDVFRWQRERIVFDGDADDESLARAFRGQIEKLLEGLPSVPMFITWRVEGPPKLLRLLRGSLGDKLLAQLCQEYGHGQPALWSLAFEVDADAEIEPHWYEEDTLLSDYLAVLAQLEESADEPLGLDTYLPQEPLDWMKSAAAVADTETRLRVLREAAVLGAELLGVEENRP